jgi:hypothetical protein
MSEAVKEELETLTQVVKAVEDLINAINPVVNVFNHPEGLEESIIEQIIKCTDYKYLTTEDVEKLGLDATWLFYWESYLDGCDGGVALLYSPSTNTYYYIYGTWRFHQERCLKLEVVKYTLEELKQKFGYC